jgi:competence protein ComEC
MQLALWATFLALGIVVAVSVAAPAVAALTAAAVLALVALTWRRAWVPLFALIALLSGITLGWRDARLATSPAAVPEDQWVEITGQVLRGPDSVQPPSPLAGSPEAEKADRSPAQDRCHLRIAIAQVAGKVVHGVLSLVVLGGASDVLPGDWVRFTARLYLPRGFSNPGLPDGRLLARGQGIDFIATVRSEADLRHIDGPCGLMAWARRRAARLRTAMAMAISARLQQPAAGFVRTMVVGERSDVPEQIEDGFRAAGATHVLSVSGLHLAVVVALFFQAAKWLLARWPAGSLRVPAKVMASVLSLPACFLYTLLTGEAVATVRSALMAAMVLGATIVNRPVSLAAGIAVAAIVLLIQSPLALLDVSFQLSFASVIGLGLFARWLVPHVEMGDETAWRRVRGWLLRSFSASFAACLVTTPLVAHHFGEITPVAPFGNLVLVPIVELVVLPCGLVGALLGLAHSWLGALPLFIAGVASRVALMLAEVFRRFAPVALVCYPNWLETLLFVAAAGCALHAAARQPRWQRKRWMVTGALAASMATGSFGLRQMARLSSHALRVTFLDVGQGDATLVEGPGGFVALVDGGGRYDNSFDTGARVVEPVLRARGISRLDLVVLSHPHPDHINGLFRILTRFPTAAFWQNGDDGRNPAYHDLVRLARERSVPMPRPTSIENHGMTMEALSPWSDGGVGVPAGLEANDASLVIRVVYAGRQILLTGDIGDEGEAEIIERRKAGTQLRSEVLKVPHHGSRYASSEWLIHAVAPVLAVVSAGRYNRFGLPSPVTLGRYLRQGAEVLRTDRDGAVALTVDAVGQLTVACMNDCLTPQSGEWR